MFPVYQGQVFLIRMFCCRMITPPAVNSSDCATWSSGHLIQYVTAYRSAYSIANCFHIDVMWYLFASRFLGSFGEHVRFLVSPTGATRLLSSWKAGWCSLWVSRAAACSRVAWNYTANTRLDTASAFRRAISSVTVFCPKRGDWLR